MDWRHLALAAAMIFGAPPGARRAADDDLDALEQQADRRGRRPRRPLRGRHPDGRRPGAGPERALRHGADHRAGDRSARLHHFQRLQLREQAGVHPGAAARRQPAQVGQAGGHRSQPHDRALEDRGRPAAADARHRPRGRDARGTMVHRRGADLPARSAQHVRGHPQRHRTRLGKGPPDRRRRCRRTTTAVRWSISAAACWA